MQRSKKIILALMLIASVLVFFWTFIAPILFGEWSASQIQFTVSSTADDRPIITFDQGSIKYSRHPFIVIKLSEIFPSRPEESRTVWEIQEDMQRWGKPLLKLTYGVCPDGFKENHAAESLQIGHYYQIGSYGIVRKNGRCLYEVITNERYAAEVKSGELRDFK